MNFRSASLADRVLLYQWRVEDEQADWWHGTAVSEKTHTDWLYHRLTCPAVHLYIAEVDGVPVGQARIDSNGELSFSIDKAHRGIGYGAELVRLATAAAYQAGHMRVKACADRTNEAGIKTMQKAGYHLRDDIVFLRHPH